MSRGSEPRLYGALLGRSVASRRTTLARRPCRQPDPQAAPGSGRGEAPAVVPHPPTPGGVGGGLVGARSSLAMPNTPNTRETAFGWVSVGPNPLNFQK